MFTSHSLPLFRLYQLEFVRSINMGNRDSSRGCNHLITTVTETFVGSMKRQNSPIRVPCSQGGCLIDEF